MEFSEQVYREAETSLQLIRRAREELPWIWEDEIAGARQRMSAVLGMPLEDVEDDGTMPGKISSLIEEIQIFEDQRR